MQPSSHKVFTQIVTGEKAEQLETAAASVRTILKDTPNDPNCLHVIGLIECQLGRLSTAMEWIEKSLAIRPDSADVQCHYALMLMEQGRYDTAVVAFRRSLALNPDNVDARYHLGNALNESGKIAEATEEYRQVVSAQPDHAEALNNLGNIFNNQGEPAQAIALYQRAVTAQPDHAMAHNNMGLAYIALDKLETAATHFRKALEINPDYAEAHNNLGIVHRLEGRFEECKPFYAKALALRPDYPDALNNLGNALKDCGQLDKAIAHYEKALHLKDSADHRHNRAIALLAVGRFEEGWREYESRWQMNQMAFARRNFTQPLWQGEPAEGRTLLIHAEQGFGDTLQFCRYVPLAKARGMRVVMEVQPALVKLLGSLAGVDTIVAQGQTLPEFDLHCSTLSLPHAFGTQLETIPATIPYLVPEKHAVASWSERLPPAKGALRIGLVWAGNARMHTPDLIATDRRRSMAPEFFTPLMNISGAQFYSLQKSGPSAPAEFGLIDWMEDCKDFADTAAFIANLDLVISVDTAVVHLAGAMGKPVWVLNRFDSCWRWMQKREDTPWYPTLRLFRQPRAGDWQSVIAHVHDELSSIISGQ